MDDAISFESVQVPDDGRIYLILIAKNEEGSVKKLKKMPGGHLRDCIPRIGDEVGFYGGDGLGDEEIIHAGM
jgi:hypothetical protein